VANSVDNGTVLLVVDGGQDDVLRIQEAISRRLPDCRVVTSRSVEDALAAAAETSIDCALIDLQAPAASGIEVCRQLKDDPAAAHVPIILVTAGENGPAIEAADPAVGPDELLARPIDENELVARIRMALRVCRAEQRAQQEREELYSAREKDLVEANETVLRSIGRNLHDTLGQDLTGLAFMVKGLARNLAGRASAETGEANEIVGMVNECVSRVRSMARGLDPVGLHGEGLVAGLGELAANTERVFGIQCAVRYAQQVVLDDETAAHLYRIAQEAVTNAVKHAGAGHIGISLRKDDHGVSLTIEDDGAGISPDGGPSNNKGMGMHIMRYRANVIGGTLTVGPGRHGGTVVTCTLADAGRSRAEG